jgi:hypothetical protein
MSKVRKPKDIQQPTDRFRELQAKSEIKLVFYNSLCQGFPYKNFAWTTDLFNTLNFDDSSVQCSVLGRSLVTATGRVFRLRMEETASRYGGLLRIYWISSRAQPTMGGPPVWGGAWAYQLLTVTKCHNGPSSCTDSLDKRYNYGKWTSDFARGM